MYRCVAALSANVLLKVRKTTAGISDNASGGGFANEGNDNFSRSDTRIRDGMISAAQDLQMISGCPAGLAELTKRIKWDNLEK